MRIFTRKPIDGKCNRQLNSQRKKRHKRWYVRNMHLPAVRTTVNTWVSTVFAHVILAEHISQLRKNKDRRYTRTSSIAQEQHGFHPGTRDLRAKLRCGTSSYIRLADEHNNRAEGWARSGVIFDGKGVEKDMPYLPISVKQLFRDS